MKRLNKRNRDIGSYLMRVGSNLTRSGQLAGMIQICRPDWSAKDAWYAARLLSEQGLVEFSGKGAITDYLAYLDTRLTGFAHQHFAEQESRIASQSEVQCWAERWQHYRKMSCAGGTVPVTFIAA